MLCIPSVVFHFSAIFIEIHAVKKNCHGYRLLWVITLYSVLLPSLLSLPRRSSIFICMIVVKWPLEMQGMGNCGNLTLMAF